MSIKNENAENYNNNLEQEHHEVKSTVENITKIKDEKRDVSHEALNFSKKEIKVQEWDFLWD